MIVLAAGTTVYPQDVPAWVSKDLACWRSCAQPVPAEMDMLEGGLQTLPLLTAKGRVC